MDSEDIAGQIISCFNKGGKLLVCGNGGSSTQASHFAAEFVNKYRKTRRALPAISLNDSALLTAISNDDDYSSVFARQVEALGGQDDILITLSTSGTSINNIYAQQVAKKKKMKVIDFPRKGLDVGEIQGYQLDLMHKICEIVEDYYYDMENPQ